MVQERVIQVKELVKKYGKHVAVDHVSADFYQREIFGLIGPNGAGKSTLLAMLAGVTRPSSGEIILKKQTVLGYVPQTIALYERLSGWDNLHFWGRIQGKRGAALQAAIDKARSVIDLEGRLEDPVEEYSGGMKRRLNIAVALLHDPDIIIMDEPMVGIDLPGRRSMENALKGLRATGKTIILTSHYLSELAGFADRIAAIESGRMSPSRTAEEFEALAESRKLEEQLFQEAVAIKN